MVDTKVVALLKDDFENTAFVVFGGALAASGATADEEGAFDERSLGSGEDGLSFVDTGTCGIDVGGAVHPDKVGVESLGD